MYKIYEETKLPQRGDILKRFTKMYGASVGVNSLLTGCAEEAERIINETWFDLVMAGVHRQHVILARDHSHDRHSCPNCNYRVIYKSHCFCSHCGSKIVWNDITNIHPLSKAC